jgi:phthalate 4,5-cis-dihydrodiol dehydrogenase
VNRVDGKTLRLGIIGLGVGAATFLPSLEGIEEFVLAAGADVNPETRDRFQARYKDAAVYETAESLCNDESLDVVWIASPNRYHAEHVLLASEHGKHVVVEKPMALTLADAELMVASAAKNGVILIAGHTMSSSAPIQAMKQIIDSRQLGHLCAINILSYTDWMLRPRTSDELDPLQGGGIAYRQAPHQVDTVRLLGGGLLRSVRGSSRQWMRERPVAGFYGALLEFEDGTPALISHNGYGHFLTNELVPWGGNFGRYDTAERLIVRRQLREGTRNEDSEKLDMRVGGSAEHVLHRDASAGPPSWLPDDLGMVLVSCEYGDIRHSQHGLLIYDDEGIHDFQLTTGTNRLGNQPELSELYRAAVLGEPPLHDGQWGLATLEACLAIIQSGADRREIPLHHQVRVPEHTATELPLAGPTTQETNK